MSKEVYETKPLSESLPPIIRFCHDAIIPIRLAFKSKWIIQGDTIIGLYKGAIIENGGANH